MFTLQSAGALGRCSGMGLREKVWGAESGSEHHLRQANGQELVRERPAGWPGCSRRPCLGGGLPKLAQGGESSSWPLIPVPPLASVCTATPQCQRGVKVHRGGMSGQGSPGGMNCRPQESFLGGIKAAVDDRGERRRDMGSLGLCGPILVAVVVGWALGWPPVTCPSIQFSPLERMSVNMKG